jgi:prepilin-type N-terminal cleavage/methylation domain-containing protein
MYRRGFTIVELIVTITIMGILLVLAVVAVSSTQLSARDQERAADVEAIKSNLEAIYTNGVSTGGSPPTITNLVPNPVVATATTGWTVPDGGGGSGTTSRVATGGPSGISTFMRRTVTSAMTSSPHRQAPTSTGASGIAVTPSTTYTLSAYARSSFDLSSGIRIDVAQYDGAAASLGTSSGSAVPDQPNQWMRVSRTFTTGASTAYIRPSVAYSGNTGAGPGSTFDSTAWMITLGSTLYDFGYGGTANWGWSGTANASTSSGPAVVSGVAGGYPSINMLGSLDLLEATLIDTDPKVLLPPGVTDPLLGFVAATNAAQSAAGVLPQPTTSQYVYQPIDSSGGLCTNTADCRKFNLYYRLEKDNTVQMVTSRNQ